MRTKLFAIVMLFSTRAFAHPGHDHAHWLSDPIHVLTVLAIVGVALVGVYMTVKNKLTKPMNKED